MPLSLNRRKKRRERVSNRTKCLGVFALATALNSLAPFFIFQESLRAKRIDELPSTTTKQSRIVSSRDTDFPWDQDNICHVVEDICKTNPFAKKYWLPDEVKKPQWRYFSRERVGNQQRARKQPKLTLDRGEPVISTTEHKMSWNELQKNKCDISKVSNHVVLHGRNIHMIGEYYQRIILPMHHMMEQYMAFSNPPSNDEKKEVQFYIDYRYFDDPKENRAKIWDSQRLYTLGLPFGDNLQTWVDEVEKSSCQCYSRLIFCGYNVDSDTNSSMTSEQKELTLTPDSYVRDNTNKYCNAGFGQTKLALETEQCDIWQKLRMSLIKTYEENNPSLNQDVSIYRKLLITNALRVFSPTFVVNDIVHHDWKIVGLSQRSDRRKWINIKDTLSHCNTRYHAEKIVCVEVNVDRLPTNFVGAYTNKSLSSVQEQMVLFRSLDSLIGIHGSQVGVMMPNTNYSSNNHMHSSQLLKPQLTQGVLMERNSIMVEISPWFPTHWGVRVHGDGWSNSRIKPT